MRLPFGFELTLQRKTSPQNLSSVYVPTWTNWWMPVREPYSGAWQSGVTADPPQNLLQSSVVYACVTGIASDIAKNRIKLSQNINGIWEEVESSPFLAVLEKPNHFENRIQFVRSWLLSKLLAGNTYVLKEREEARGLVKRLYVLDPRKVRVLVADDGSVFYQLTRDPLSQVTEVSGIFDTENPIVPASEIIHDRMAGLFHPLVGVPPIFACAMTATMGNKIKISSTNQFANMSRPGGILTAPGHINDDTATRLKTAFEANYGGANYGRTAVLGDGLTFEPMQLTAENSQLAEQLDWTDKDVCTAFHYPHWKIGGPMPAYSNGPQAITQQYYNDCLHTLIEELELCLDEGLEFPPTKNYGTEVDLDNLMRMDTAALFDSNNKAVAGGWMKPDEARFRANLEPVPGGNTPYLQQQNFSLAALAKRDAKADPFESKAPQAATPPSPAPVAESTVAAKEISLEDLEYLESESRKELELV